MSEFGGGNIEGFWTEERVRYLKELSDLGQSDNMIARAMGCGCTKNMILGKRRRMGFKTNAPRSRVDLKQRPAPVGPVAVPRQPAAPRPAPPAVIPTAEPEAIGAIEDFADGCQWIHGDPSRKGWRMCGQPSSKKRFCEYHHAKSLAPKGTKPIREQQEAEALRQGVMARTGLG